MNDFPIETVLDILDKVYPYHPMGDVTGRDPYKVLICCLLSLRNRDVITMPACLRLFEAADTPQKMVQLPREEIVARIYPVQFYQSKADTLLRISQDLLDRYSGQVPDTVEELITLKGVGRKTANLVVALGYNKPAISVDTHVHRISNRLGYVATRTPEETETALRQTLPLKYWPMINRVMVRHGQEVCLPRLPQCAICPVNAYCQKVGVSPRKKAQTRPSRT